MRRQRLRRPQAALNLASIGVRETTTAVARNCIPHVAKRNAGEAYTSTGELTMNGGDTHHVPKGFLVSGLESRMHSGELKIAAELTESPALKEELRDFGRKVSESGRVTYN